MKIILSFQKTFPRNIEWYWKKIANFINYWTKSEYFHVEIAIDGKWIISCFESGVIIKDYQENVFDPDYDYYEFEISDLTEIQKELFWDWINKEVGTGYDKLAIIFTQFINLEIENKDKWFCSEITARILQLFYVKEFIDCKPNMLAPKHIYEMLKHRLKKLN